MAVWKPELTLPIKIGKYDAPQLYFCLQHQQHQSISLAYLLFHFSTIDLLESFPSRGRSFSHDAQPYQLHFFYSNEAYHILYLYFISLCSDLWVVKTDKNFISAFGVTRRFSLTFPY